ncbi:hypothetical protein GCM10028778_06240 [Barrientosiimonas marina]|uniref:Uncharacterized protein n=1 Tax=Lentibacillus kimchii TaxID=1542911 RepID=A0ABW2UYW6_9BACI
MADQEQYKNLMQKMIQETENHRIQSAEEMIQKLVSELSGKTTWHPDH